MRAASFAGAFSEAMVKVRCPTDAWVAMAMPSAKQAHGAPSSRSASRSVSMAMNRLNAKPRELTVVYYDSDHSPNAPCARAPNVIHSSGVSALAVVPQLISKRTNTPTFNVSLI